MSSSRVSALKGGVEPLPGTAAAHRASANDAADPAGGGFAAALGALAANFHSPSGDHPFHGSDDASTGDDPADAQAADDSAPAAGKTPAKAADTTGAADDTAQTATLPGLAGWFAGTGSPSVAGTPTSVGQRGQAKPGATAVGAAAAAIAASLVGSAPQPPTPTAVASPSAGKTVSGQPDLAAAQLAQPGFEAAIPASAAALAGHTHTAPGGAPLAGVSSGGPVISSKGNGVTGTPVSPGDATAPAAPGIAADAGSSMPGLADSGAAASAVTADPSAQAAASPVPTVRPDAATLADAAASAIAATAGAVASSAGGSGGRDFADTGRDGQAAAMAALGGIAAASTGSAAPSGFGAPSSAATGPSLGGDAGAANVATQLSGQVLRLLANSGHQAMVRLNPPDLGEVTVRVAVSGRDVSAWFGSPQPDVQQSISAGLGQLQTDLGNAGYSLNNAWVGADASGFGAGGDAPPPPAPIAAPTQAAPVTPVAATVSSNSGVSIYV